jgi:hypothetical protein
MDFFPSLGEPGILDDLFWFGPLVLQVILGAFFFWLTGRWMRKESRGTRLVCAVGMVIGCDVLLFLAFGIVFKMSTGL